MDEAIIAALQTAQEAHQRTLCHQQELLEQAIVAARNHDYATSYNIVNGLASMYIQADAPELSVPLLEAKRQLVRIQSHAA